MFRHRFILKEEDVSASMAADTSIVEVSGIGVFCKDHVTRTVGDAIVWVYGENPAKAGGSTVLPTIDGIYPFSVTTK